MDIREYIQSGIIEQYVLGLASTEEIAELEQLRSEHPEVKQAIEEFEQRFQEYLLANPVQPAAHIKSSLEKQLFGESSSQTDNITNSIASQQQSPSVYNIGLWKYMAAASIILLLISTALNFYFYSGFKSTQQQYQALLTERNTLQANNASYKRSLEIFEDTAMIRIDMKGMPGKENNLATILWNKNSKDVFIYTSNLQHIPEGKQYQLWAIVDGKPVDAGLINNCSGLCKMKRIIHAEAFAVTLEKEGGSVTPTLTQMYVMGKV